MDPLKFQRDMEEIELLMDQKYGGKMKELPRKMQVIRGKEQAALLFDAMFESTNAKPGGFKYYFVLAFAYLFLSFKAWLYLLAITFFLWVGWNPLAVGFATLSLHGMYTALYSLWVADARNDVQFIVILNALTYMTGVYLVADYLITLFAK